MYTNRIATRYAKSLIALAIEQEALETVHSDIQRVQQALQHRGFYLLLKNPIISADKKAAIVKAIFEGKVSALMLAYMELLIRKGREPYLPEITREFLRQYKILKRITPVRIISATPLSEATIAQIQQRIFTSGLTTENLEITTEVDPSLIGGYILEFEDKRYDASIS